MRLTYGVFRSAVRDPAVRLSSYATQQPFPTPYATATSAIRRFHTEGPEQARRQLDRSFRQSAYWGDAGRPQQRGWADAIRACLGNYETMTSGDARTVVMTATSSEVAYGPNEVSVTIDVVLLSPSGGYVGRILLWDTAELTRQRATLFASPVIDAMRQELDDVNGLEAEVWNLRSRAQFVISMAEADAVRSQVSQIVALASELI